MYITMQFLDLSKTIYGSVAGPSHSHVEEIAADPSASLNDWLVFPSMEDLEVCFFVATLFVFVLLT
jgi:hypothetical protein